MRHLRFTALAGLLAGVPLHAQLADPAPPVGVRADSIVPETGERAAAATVTELLQGKIAGLNVAASSGTLGAAPRLWMRGMSSLVLDHRPLVVVDGIRVASDARTMTSGAGTLPTSRLEELAPAEVASVRVLRGPAATAMYGPDAANGVLEIRTRSAAAAAAGGRPRVHGWSELSLRSEVADYPEIHVRPGVDASGAAVVTCTARAELAGACIPGRAAADVSDPVGDAAPFRTGLGYAAGAEVGGGVLGNRVGYGVQAGFEDAEGVHARSGRRQAHLGGSARVALPGGGSAVLSATHARRELDLPFEGNTIFGRAYRELLRVYPPGGPTDDAFYDNRERWERTRLGAAMDLPVLPWLALGGRIGRDDAEGTGASEISAGQQTVSPYRTAADARHRRTEWEAGATARGSLGGGLSGNLTLATGRMDDSSSWENRTVAAGPQQSEGGSWWRETGHVSARGGLQIAHLSVGGGVRRDRAEGAGDDGERDSYSLGAEWSLAEERWMPAAAWLDGLRLRAAHGRTERGLEYGGGGILFVGPPGCVGCPAPARPLERHEETEAGVDLAVHGAVELGATLYRRDTRGLVAPGFQGLAADVGTLRSRGLELEAAVHGAARGAEWRVELRSAWNRNRLEAEEGAAYFGDGVVHRDGHPAGSLYSRPVTWDDRNGNGVLECIAASCEVQLGSEAEYMGTTVPERVGSAGASLRVRGVRLHALADWQGGVHRVDRGRLILCGQASLCAESYAPGADLEAQAGNLVSSDSYAGFVDDASFLRLREVAVTVSAPARLFGARAADALELTVAGRNLALRSRWPGLDPETASSGPSPFAATDIFAQPLPRTVTMRLDVRF